MIELKNEPESRETEQITDAIEASVGSPSKGDETSTTQSALMAIVLEKIEAHELDLRSMVTRMHSGGLSGKVGTWVGTSDNATVSADEVEKALGPKIIESLSKEAGIPPREVAAELATLLPKLIDKFTPQGSLPEDSTIKEAAAKLASKIA